MSATLTPKTSVGTALAVAVLLATLLVAGPNAEARDPETFSLTEPLPEGHVLVIGFLGGRNAWDDDRRGIRQTALRLRDRDLRHVHVETFENRKRRDALAFVHAAFDRDRDGRLSAAERASIRLIVYGQSFGGAAVVKFARQLEELDVPVLLTVQVDSVGRGDAVIPPNVARAANLSQQNGLFLRGERHIRAEDSSRTTIIGNYVFDYDGKKVDLPKVSWYERLFERLFTHAHTKMDADPAVWDLVESFILQAIPRRLEEREGARPADGPADADGDGDDTSQGPSAGNRRRDGTGADRSSHYFAL